jgi:ribosomal-protein-alanine N-acetyltransferase
VLELRQQHRLRLSRTFETERLVGEPASERHRDVAVALFGDPDVAAAIWPAGREGTEGCGPRTPAQAEQMLARFVGHWREHGFGWWYLRERESGEYVGEVGLQRTEVDYADVVEVGWTLFPSYWNRGLATEAAREAIALGFGPLALDEIFSFTMPSNLASRRVMEKLGMGYLRDIERAGLPHVLYRLSAPA